MSAEKRKGFPLHPIQIIIEIAIVAIGIVIAFQLSNWRLDRDRGKSEIKILQEIKSNLELDLIDINGNIIGHQRKIHFIDSLRNHGDYEISEVKVGLYLTSIFRDYIFTPQTSAYETLKAKGVDLISNDSLRMKILRMYDFNYVSMIKIEEEWEPAKMYQHLEYIKEKYYDRIDISTPVIKAKSNGNSWLDNADIQIRLDHASNETQFILKFYGLILEEGQDTIESIEAELKGKLD